MMKVKPKYILTLPFWLVWRNEVFLLWTRNLLHLVNTNSSKIYSFSFQLRYRNIVYFSKFVLDYNKDNCKLIRPVVAWNWFLNETEIFYCCTNYNTLNYLSISPIHLLIKYMGQGSQKITIVLLAYTYH